MSPEPTTLRAGHRKAIGLEEETGEGGFKPAQGLAAYYARHEKLSDLPAAVIRKAWFTMSHLMLSPGAHVADMGCEDGMMTYAMAALNPQLRITGVDSNRKLLAKARQKWKLPNLDFIVGDMAGETGFGENTLDALINSFVLHEVYSDSRLSVQSVTRALERQFSLLKQDGQIFIRDFAVPSAGEYVLLEMPDSGSAGKEPETMSETQLLVWYSENARPRDDSGCPGFFLEDLPSRFPKTRLFRLPSKWAYEFIMRKDDRALLKAELPREYAFFSQNDFHKNLGALGARVLYSSPHWDDAVIRERFEGHFRLYDDNGAPLGQPPTSFIAVAQKMGPRRSLRLQERRPSPRGQGTFRITAMRNEANGRLTEIISRDAALTDILPYRITDDGLLNVFVHDGLPRGIVNAVPRNGKNIDGKRWSGHMTEAIAVESDVIHGIGKDNVKGAVLFARDYLGLKPAADAAFEEGPAFYPAPDYIDERIETRFLRVEGIQGSTAPRKPPPDIAGFSTVGQIVELDAQNLLNAISVGLIPNATLEMQILSLFQHLGIKAESWAECPLVLKEETIENTFDARAFMNRKIQRDSRYKNIKGTTGQMRAVRSIFVDEGWVDGGLSGLAARDLEFVISDDSTVNKAVVLPLSRSHSGEVMAGVLLEYMPIPQRYQGNGLSLNAPSFVLPKDVTNIEQARKFIAEKFDVPVENVGRMGESFYCHVGITPQRIFPFAVTGVAGGNAHDDEVSAYAPIHELWKILNWGSDRARSFMKLMAIATSFTGKGNDSTVRWDFARQTSAGAQKPAALSAEDMRGIAAAADKGAENPLNPK